MSRPPAALGTATYLAGIAGAVGLSTGRPAGAVAAAAVAAFGVGLVGGGLLVTSERGARLLATRLTTWATGGGLVGLGAWVTWAGLQTGAERRYQLTIASVFVAVVGWGILAGSDHRDGFGERLATLPKTDRRERVDADGRRRWLGAATSAMTVAVVGYFVWRAVARGDLSSGLFAGLFFAVFLPGTKYGVELTDDGVVATRYVVWLVPVGRTVLPWRAIYGYEATDERLRIATEFDGDLTYDPERIDERDRVVGILDEQLPRL